MRVPTDAIISIAHDYDSISFRWITAFECKYFVSNRNEIPRVGAIIEADLGNQYVDAYVTNVYCGWNGQIELSAQVVESRPAPVIPTFDFDPSLIRQQLVSMFPHAW